jgi:hypothetical protein
VNGKIARCSPLASPCGFVRETGRFDNIRSTSHGKEWTIRGC